MLYGVFPFGLNVFGKGRTSLMEARPLSRCARGKVQLV